MNNYHFHAYHDDWIIENYLKYPSYEQVAKTHNKLFNTDITTSSMKAHCRKMGLVKPKQYVEYTDEEIDWLIANYPLLGIEETTKQFNKQFNTDRTKSAIKNFGHTHGIKVDDDVATVNKTRPTHNNPNSKRCKKPAGTLRLEVGRWVMKKEDGTWDQASRVIYEKHFGPIPKNYSIIFLDNDINNLDPENLLAIPHKYLGLLSKYNLKSISKEITLTGIKWCELYEILKEKEKKHYVR